MIYLSMNMHQRNRLYQASLLRQQTLVLDNIVDPRPPAPPPTAREVRAGLTERFKDRWNTELEAGVRRLYAVNWNDIRDSAEEGVSSVWRRLFSQTRETVKEAEVEVKKQVNEKVIPQIERTRAEVQSRLQSS